MGIGRKMFHRSFYPYSLSAKESKMVVNALMYSCASFLPIPRHHSQCLFSHPTLRKHRAAGFQASFCNWEMMIRLAVQVEPKVKEWDQHLAVCVGKGVQDYCTVSSVGGKQKMCAVGLGSMSTLTALH